MNVLTQDSIDGFLERFYSFSDSVLRAIDVVYQEDGTTSIAVTIAARDASEQDDEWVRVVLRLESVSEYSFCNEVNHTLQVLSDGIHTIWWDDQAGLDFGWLVDEPDDLTELRTSKAYACAKVVTWSVQPY